MQTRLKFVSNCSAWCGAGSCELQLQLGAAQGAECGSQGKLALGVQEPLSPNATKSVSDFMA